MAISNIEIQDENGNIYYPKTGANDVFFEDGTTFQQKLDGGELKGATNLVDGKATGSIKSKDIIEDDIHTLGEYSSTFGLNNTAYGNYSHVEGHKNMSFDTCGHCEGFNTYNLRGGYRVNKSVIGENTTILYLDMYDDDFILDDWIKSNKVSIILTLKNNQSVITDSKFVIANVVKFDRPTHTIEIENLDISDFNFYMVTHDIINFKDASNRTYAGHSEGYSNITIGSSNHAEGYKNIISGSNSHVEGSNNFGEGSNNHIEGNRNFGTGNFSHIEGRGNHNFGRCNHIEGDNNVAYGNEAHIEGVSNMAYGDKSHASGLNTISTSGTKSFHGQATTGSKIIYVENSLYWGNINDLQVGNKISIIDQFYRYEPINCKIIRIGVVPPRPVFDRNIIGNTLEIEIDTIIPWSIVTNDYTLLVYLVMLQYDTSYNYLKYPSVSNGCRTIASGSGSYAGGYKSYALGESSFVYGSSSITIGDFSSSFGSVCAVTGYCSSSFGSGNTVYSDYSISAGSSNGVWANNSAIFGNYNRSNIQGTFLSGQSNISIVDGWFLLTSNIYNNNDTTTYYYKYSRQNNLKLNIGCKLLLNTITDELDLISFDNTNKTITVNGKHDVAIDSYSRNVLFIKHLSMYENNAHGAECGIVNSYCSSLLASGGALFGDSNIICGYDSFSSGCYNRIYSNFSSTLGSWLISYDDSQTVIGKDNVEKDYIEYRLNTEKDMFVIGNGSNYANRSNAFRVTGAGATYGMSAFNSTGADYAEFFEWADANPNSEDRVGHFVTFENDKIKIANLNDDYILGVISGNPSVIGNSHNDMWNEMYIRDEFDRIIYEDVEVPDTFKTIHHDAVYENQNINPLDIDTNKESNILISEAYDEEVLDEPKHMEHRMKINPKYDPSHKYIPREKRPEWSAVGMLGVLPIYDDGTCVVNGYATVSNNGTATSSQRGYRVIKRLSDNIVKILFRS